MSSVNKSSDYAPITDRISRYRYARIPLNNLSSGTVTIQPTSITLLEWKISASTVINLSKSYIAYTTQVPALAANYGVSFEHGADFRQVYWGNGSGMGIVDLQFADQYMNVVRPLGQKFQSFITKDQLDHCYPCKQLNSSNLLPFSRDGLSAGTDVASTDSYIEQQHLFISPTANTAIQLARYMSLSDCKDTMLAQNVNTVYGTDMYLRMYTNLGQRMCYYTTTPATPNLNTTAIVANMTFSNVYLYLAVEENISIRNMLLADLAAGNIKLSIPYTYCYRFSSAGNSASANISLTLTKNYGRALKKVLFVPCNAQEFTNFSFDHSNCNGTKINQLQTTLDGRPLTDYVLNCYNYYSSIVPTGTAWSNPINFSDDWREAQKMLTETAIAGQPQFQTHWFYSDVWGELPSSTHSDINKENIQDGFDLLLSGDHVYSISASTVASQTNTSNIYTNGLILYLYCTFLRTLDIKPDGIVLSA